MKAKWTSLILVSVGLSVGCGDNASTTVDAENPMWVEQVLSTSPNDVDLEGTWSISSVLTYETGDCSGESTSHDYSGAVTYGESAAIRTNLEVLSEADFSAKGYSPEEFAEMCTAKGGEFNSDNDCAFLSEVPFKYYLGDKGYCEMYAKAGKGKKTKAGKKGKGKKAKASKAKYWCGSLEMDGETATITYSFVSDYPGKSFSKVVELTKE